jgi:hypothetical protein
VKVCALVISLDFSWLKRSVKQWMLDEIRW